MTYLTKEVTFDEAVSFIKSEKLINRSYIAERMYPDVKCASANAKFHNKLRGVNRFRFTEREQIKLTQLLTMELRRIAALVV